MNEYTLMPASMSQMFSVDQLRAGMELVEPFSFTKGCRTMRIPARPAFNTYRHGTRLYDLDGDPQQQAPMDDAAIEQRMIDHMTRLMCQCEAPPEQFERLGLEEMKVNERLHC